MGSLIQSSTMASKSAQFFENGTNKQFEFVLSKYQDALQAKADSKNSKSEILIKLDKWYQNELPKKIKSRGKEAHLTHEEIVQTIKWKLARGQFRPRLKDLIQMNTPRVVMQETKKAFRAISKKNDLEAAVSALSNLKGVGPAMASAVLAAGAPEVAPFMADECLLSMPEVEGIDYTMKEYMKLVEKTKECVERLNAQGGSWNPHKVELAIWAYFIARDLKPELLDDMPDSRGNTYPSEPVKEAVVERVNGENGMNGEVSKNGGQMEESKEVVENQTNGVAEVDDSQKSVHSLSPEPEAEPIGFNQEPEAEPIGFSQDSEPVGFSQEAEPIGFSQEAEPVGFNPEPMGFNYNGVGSESNEASNGSLEAAEEMPTEVPTQAGERPMNGDSTKEVPLLENSSSCPIPYPAYTDYSEPASMYSTHTPITLPEHVPVYSTPMAPIPEPAPVTAPVDHIPAPTAKPVETPVYTKRPLDESEEATPESKRVREEYIPTPDTAEAASRPEPVPEPSNHISQELPMGGVVEPAPSVPECPAQNGVISAPPQPIHTGGD